MEIEMMSRALSGQKTSCDFGDDIASFPWLRRVTSELAPKPMAAALVVVINVLRFMVSGLNDSQLLHQGEIVLDVPVVSNSAILDAQNVGRDEINSLTRSLLLPKNAIEMAQKMEMCDHAVAR